MPKKSKPRLDPLDLEEDDADLYQRKNENPLKYDKVLAICADLQGLTDLQPQGGVDDERFQFTLKIKCLCKEEFDVTMSLGSRIRIPKENIILIANAISKCKKCGRGGTVAMVEGKGRPLTSDDSVNGTYVPLMKFLARGFEPVGFIFGIGWKAISTGGKTFYSIDLSHGEFEAFCEKSLQRVCISNTRSQFDDDTGKTGCLQDVHTFRCGKCGLVSPTKESLEAHEEYTHIKKNKNMKDCRKQKRSKKHGYIYGY